MRLVDSSAWIEWLEGSPFGDMVAQELPPRHEWLVPTIIQFELSKWVLREGGEDKIDEIIALTEVCVVVDLDTATALIAAELGRKHKLASADAIIYATARAHEADLLTCDRHFEGLPGVLYIPKLKS